MWPFSKKTRIKVVQDEKLIGYLKSIGAYEDIDKGKTHCAFCGKKITTDNLQALYPDGGNIKIVCSKINCIKKLEEDGT
jgi:hypothetical protein